MKDQSLNSSQGTTAAAVRFAHEADHFLVRWNSEIFALYNKRMQEYCMLPFSLMTCASADDVADVQTAFLETLRADYSAAAAQFGQLVGREAVPSSSSSYSEALLKAQDDARAILDQAKAQAKRILAEAEARVCPEANSGNGSAAAAA